MDEENKPKRRGPGKRTRMVLVHLRVHPDVAEYFKTYPVPTAQMREVLTDYAYRNELKHRL